MSNKVTVGEMVTSLNKFVDRIQNVLSNPHKTDKPEVVDKLKQVKSQLESSVSILSSIQGKENGK